MAYPPLIAALMHPACYPDTPQSVELRETHASWVLLAGAFAYKIKKPVTLPFLDYGSLAQRKSCCEKELALNQRYAPEVYLAVVPLTGSPETPCWGGDGAVIEYAVKMRRFDEACRLDQVCSRGELQHRHLSDLAQTLTLCHGRAGVARDDAAFGLPERIMDDAMENLLALAAEPTLPAPDRDRVERLRRWTESEGQRCAPTFLARKAQGCIRECHGDLHLGNLVLIEGQIVPFDCIEFNDSFRWIDVASEVAFLYVDLLAHRQPGLAGWWLSEWLSMTGDYAALEVLRFYAVYRALVRAKVAVLRALQCEGDLAEVQAYLHLAEHLAWPPASTLTITFGVSGSGKSYASRQWVLQDPDGRVLRLRSDVERKRLHGLASHEASGSALDGGIYTAEAHAATYRRLASLAEFLLTQGWSVVVDAAFLRRAERAQFHAIAMRRAVPFAILARSASEAVLRQRVLEKRRKTTDPSEATLEVLARQLRSHEPLVAEEQAWVVTV